MILSKAVEKQVKENFNQNKAGNNNRVGYFLPKYKREDVVHERRKANFNFGYGKD